MHAAVRRSDDEPLRGAHVILSEPPKAENVSYLLYRGVRYGETRAEIVRRIAAYSVASHFSVDIPLPDNKAANVTIRLFDADAKNDSNYKIQ